MDFTGLAVSRRREPHRPVHAQTVPGGGGSREEVGAAEDGVFRTEVSVTSVAEQHRGQLQQCKWAPTVTGTAPSAMTALWAYLALSGE